MRGSFPAGASPAGGSYAVITTTPVVADAAIPLAWGGSEYQSMDADGVVPLGWLTGVVSGVSVGIAHVSSLRVAGDTEFSASVSQSANADLFIGWIFSGRIADGMSALAWLASQQAERNTSLANQAQQYVDRFSEVAWASLGQADVLLAASYSALGEQELESDIAWLAQAASDGRLPLALGLRSGAISDVRLSAQLRAALVQAIERRIDLSLQARSARIH